MPPLIQIVNLHYRPDSFPATKPDILRGISLEIERGEFVALLGANGSGKTTLLKHINGLLHPTKGSVRVNGYETRIPENQKKIQTFVGMVFQNPEDQIVASTVAEDIAFGLENANLPTQEIHRRVNEQLSAADLIAEKERPPHLLSGGQTQKLALAGVLARQPDVILFDEPTSMLDPLSRRAFQDRIHKLNQAGLTVIYVTQHMEEALLADRIFVLNAGSIITQGTPSAVFSQTKALAAAGLEQPESLILATQLRELGLDLDADIVTEEDLLSALPAYQQKNLPPQNYEKEHDPYPTPNVLIELKDVVYTYHKETPLAQLALQGVDLQLTSGGIHGIAGVNGSGKSTLLQHINSILRPEQGSVRVGSLMVSEPKTRLRDVVQMVGLVFQNPETQFFEQFVGDEIAYGPKQFQMEDIRKRVEDAMALVGVNFSEFKDRRLETLSGGEKRKIAIASTLVLNQEVLLFDEPTAGMDPHSRNDLLALFRQLCNMGKTLLVASHRIEELAQIGDDLAIMQRGRVLKKAPRKTALDDPDTFAAAGLEPPLATKAAQVLKGKGWPINMKDTSTPERLVRALRSLL